MIGRASVSELRLQHNSVSRRHAQLTRNGEHFYIKDLSSQDWHLRQQAEDRQRDGGLPGDLLTIGNALVKLRGPLQQAEASLQARVQKARPVPQRNLAAAAAAKQGAPRGRRATSSGWRC